MARPRKKKRTHVGAVNGHSGQAQQTLNLPHEPQTMVIRIGAGEIGSSLSRLAQDVRNMMEPSTASKLKERRSNRLRDYTAMAGPLRVSHLLLFSRSEAGNVTFRVALTPRGPTLNFRVNQYSLARDVSKGQRQTNNAPKIFQASPLLVMNNFNSSSLSEGMKTSSAARLESLVTTVFQSLFPPISPHRRPLSSVRRVVLLNRMSIEGKGRSTPEDYVLLLRHYAVITTPAKVSRGVRRLHTTRGRTKGGHKPKRAIPDLEKLEDVSDLLLDPTATASGFTSATESELDEDAEVEVSNPSRETPFSRERDMQAQSSKRSSLKFASEKRKVKLVEIGPRLKMSLIKIEEGICSGKTLYHSHFSKSPEEEERMDQIRRQRQQEKEERRDIQAANLQRKQKEGSNIDQVDEEEADPLLESDANSSESPRT